METGENLPKLNQDIIGSATSVEDIVSALSRRGCVDLTPSINLAACSDHPCAGGGFCDVYRGELYNGFKIAIKCLRVYDGPNGDNQRQKILKHAAKELYHWSKLRHRNVLPLVGLAFFRGHISMVSQWMDNGNLTSFLRLNLDANRMCFCVDVCAGLCYIHENGMVHGDLKAANVMVSSHGVAMITDFGNAQLKDITLKFSNTTSHGISVRWAAPELLESDVKDRQASKEADVYAYGMTALEVLSGKIPYEELSDIQVIRLVAIKKEHPPRPQVDLDDTLWDILIRCWSWSPNERPSITTINNYLCAMHPECTSHSYSGSLSPVHGVQGGEDYQSGQLWEQLDAQKRLSASPLVFDQPTGSRPGPTRSLGNSPHASTHPFLSSPLQFLTDHHIPDPQPSSAGSFKAGSYSPLRTAQGQGETHTFPSTASTSSSPAYPYRDPPFTSLHNPLYIPSPSGTQLPLSDLFPDDLSPGIPASRPRSQSPDFAAPPRDYFDASASTNQPNPAATSVIENIVQQALSAQQAFDRGENFTVQERLAEITRALRDLGLSKGVLGLDNILPPLVEDPPLPTDPISMSPLQLSPSLGSGAGSSPPMYGNNFGYAEVPYGSSPGGTKRTSKLTGRALGYTPPREIGASRSASPGFVQNVAQRALSAQPAFDRGERFTAQERLMEAATALRGRSGRGVLSTSTLPPLIDDYDPTLPASSSNLSLFNSPTMGAGSGPSMYVGNVGDVKGVSDAGKRVVEADEGPSKALRLTSLRETNTANSASSGHSPPLPDVTASIPMHGAASIGATRQVTSALGLATMHPPSPLMHAHMYPGGLRTPHVPSSLAAMPYGNMGAVVGVPTLSEPATFRSEPSLPLGVDPYSMRSDDSDVDPDGDSDGDSGEGHRHVKQGYPSSTVPLDRVIVPRQTPPKRMGTQPGDSTPNISSSTTLAHSANVLPPELKSEVDRVFFKFLNWVCSNLEATDSKGEAIHQTLMAKKMARLDELPDFRPFKFRIQSFTNGFLEELASEGYPDDVIPMKKIKSYLRYQPYICRFNEDGKKAKSKGNPIWKIDARKIDNGGAVQWTFREFKRKIAGTPPGIAYHGHLWQWAPHVWDPQASRANITVTFSSPSLPPWLSWSDNVLSGTPGFDAVDTDITVHARVLGDTDEQVLAHTFNLTIAPSAVDPAFVKSRRPSLDVRRNVSDTFMRTRAGPTPSNPSNNDQVMQVLARAVSRVTHAMHAAQTGASSTPEDPAALAKQQQVLNTAAQAVADEIRAGPHPDSHGTASALVVVAHSVVIGATQLVLTDRVSQATRTAGDPAAFVPAQAPMSVTEVSVATQSAVAHAVAISEPIASELEVMMTANALIQQQQFQATTEALEATQAASRLIDGIASRSGSPQMSQAGSYRSRSMSLSGSPVPSMGL